MLVVSVEGVGRRHDAISVQTLHDSDPLIQFSGALERRKMKRHTFGALSGQSGS